MSQALMLPAGVRSAHRVIAAIAVSAVSAAMVRTSLRLDADAHSEDDLLALYVDTATRLAEHETGRAIITQTVETIGRAEMGPGYAAAGCSTAGVVLRPRVQQILSVDTWSGQGWQPQDVAAYLAAHPLTGTESVPVLPGTGPLRITYRAGYGDDAASVPACIQQWLLAHVQSWYCRPGAVSEKSLSANPMLRSLLDPERTYL